MPELGQTYVLSSGEYILILPQALTYWECS